MATVTVEIGEVWVVGGREQDNTLRVEFEGKRICARIEYGTKKASGVVDDMRGVTRILFKTADSGLIVHTLAWSKRQGEPSVSRLEGVCLATLQPGGRYELLGTDAGYGRPLTLLEALERCDEGDKGDEDPWGRDGSERIPF